STTSTSERSDAATLPTHAVGLVPLNSREVQITEVRDNSAIRSDETLSNVHTESMSHPRHRLLHVASPTIILGTLVGVYELIMWLGLAFGGAEAFATWLTNFDETISGLAAQMWKAIDWT
ncbi:hypothetical protein SARC_16619, partial [Sphaeroforma arctica JP610]